MLRAPEKTNFNYRSENGSSEAFGALTGTGSFTRKGEVLRALAHGLRDCPGAGSPSLQHIPSLQGCHQASGSTCEVGKGYGDSATLMSQGREAPEYERCLALFYLAGILHLLC